MGRGKTVTEASVALDEVDVPDVNDEIEDITDAPTGSGQEEKPKEPAKPKRGDLPTIEGDEYITPVAFAKLLSQPLDGNPENDDASNWRNTDKNGSHVVPPQMIYSYIKSSKEFVSYDGIVDSNGVVRNNLLKLSEANAYWDGRAGKAAERAANAKAKAEKKAAKAETSTTTVDAESVGEVVEAE